MKNEWLSRRLLIGLLLLSLTLSGCGGGDEARSGEVVEEESDENEAENDGEAAEGED